MKIMSHIKKSCIDFYQPCSPLSLLSLFSVYAIESTPFFRELEDDPRAWTNGNWEIQLDF